MITTALIVLPGSPAAAAPVPGELTQTGYIFENDDEDEATGDPYDENTPQAPGNTAIADVAAGERVNARLQLRNTGGSIDGNAALFYDRNDGIWTKVRTHGAPVAGAGTGCADNAYDCTTVDNGPVGAYASMAVDSTGKPWVSHFDSGSGDMRVSRHVGAAGTGCVSPAWTCVPADAAVGDGGYFSSIALDQNDAAWASHYDVTGKDLRVARYVGTGGTGCGPAEWSCTLVDANTDVGSHTSIAVDPAGNPWVSYHHVTDGDLRVARQVGSGGTNCNVAAWSCTVVDSADVVGSHTALAFDPAGNPWVSYYDATNADLRVARFVGSGGTGCASTAWTCTAVETTGNVGTFTSIAFDPAGNPWVSHYDATNADLRVARFVGSGGTGCASSAWTCTAVHTAGNAGEHASLAFDPGGRAWISYYDSTNADLQLTRFVGSGGTGCASAAWTCTSLDTGGNVGQHTSLAFDPAGNPWVSYQDVTNADLRVARLRRGGEITMSMARGAATADPLQESHADMSSTGDTANRDDADCIGGGSWNNGSVTTTEETSLTLPDSTAVAQCTELTYSLDTSGASPGVTYRLVLATKEAWRADKGPWRGMTSVSAYPTMTIRAATTTRHSTDTFVAMAACADASWGCVTVDGSTGSVGTRISSAFDPSGNMWISYRDATNLDLKVARYVGAGGTGCTTTTAWTCVAIETANDVGDYTSVAFDSAGNPWVAHRDITNLDLRIARYVGSGGTGCASTAWTCQAVDSAGDTGHYVSLAFDDNGNAWIAQYANTDLRVARHVGTGGTGCSNSAWTCVNVDTAGSVGSQADIAFGAGGAWIVYRHITNADAKVARYVGAGGTGCATPQWSCETIDSTEDAGVNASIAVDAEGKPWISYKYFGDGDPENLVVARYVGTGGTGCETSVTRWTCTTVDTVAQGASYSSIALDASGNPWVSYRDSNAFNLLVARLVGSGGTGCDVPQWTCATIDTGGDVGAFTSLAFDRQGVPWVSYYDATNTNLRAAKLLAPTSKPVVSTGMGGASASRANGRYLLSHGDTVRPADASCDGIAPRTGYCGTAADDAAYDSITAAAGERPVYLFSRSSASNTASVHMNWVGRSSVAPSTSALTMQIWRGGATNAWETVNLQVNTCGTAVAAADCQMTGSITANLSDYYEAVGAAFWYHVRMVQAAHTGATTLSTDVFDANIAPNSPASLEQKDSGGAAIATGGSTASTTITFAAQVSDVNNPDTLALCVEVDLVGTAFSGTEDGCGTGAAFSGAAVTVSVDRTLATGDYHWQVRVKDAAGAYSAWLSYGGNAESAIDFTVVASTNVAPNAATGLSQRTAADVVLPVGAWHNGTSITFTASASDPDASDSLALCVEVKPLADAFTNSEDGCGTSVAYSGSAVTVTVGRTLAAGAAYHWQVRVRDSAGAYSAWTSFGGNAESERDLGIDTAAPVAGTVYDGSSAEIDAAFNDGSLTSLSANWSGFSDAVSGIASYSYAVGTTPSGTEVLGWTSAALGTTAAPTGLVLSTSVTYYVGVRAVDAAGNTTTVSSNGQQVAPSLGFSIAAVAAAAACGEVTTTVASSPGALDLGRISSPAQRAVAGQNLTVTTNGAAGYTVHVSYVGQMTGQSTGHVLADAPGTNAVPAAWPAAGTAAFGYTTASTTLSGVAARFAGPLWAAFSTSYGEVARRTTPTAPTDTTCLAVAASIAGNTPPDSYTAILRYTVTPMF